VTKDFKQLVLSPVHYEEYLKKELSNIEYTNKRNVFLLKTKISHNLRWQNSIWPEINYIAISSIKDAAKKLQAIRPFWHYIAFNEHRRAELISENLLPKKKRRIEFNAYTTNSNYGEWSLLDKETLIYCVNSSHPHPLGQCEFLENKKDPPSRAYLKLWEVFTFYMPLPDKNDVAIDLGACPGGWSWVLKDHVKKIYSIDTAPIEVAANNIVYQAKDAFQLDITALADINMLFSDMACEPLKLLALVKDFLALGKIHTCICTIKLNDSIDEEKICNAFLEIQPSRIVHLYQNKHELTWLYSSK